MNIKGFLLTITALFFITFLQSTAQAQSGDPTGFTDQLNAVRVQRGLPPVAYNPGYVSVAAQNNAWQAVRGLGHHVLGGLAQCAGVGPADCQSILSLWLSSPSHAAILLSPSLASVGYHQSGAHHTVSGSMGFNMQFATQPLTNPAMTGIAIQSSAGYVRCKAVRFRSSGCR